MAAVTLMVQGTTSDAGKSTIVTAICRVLRRRGVRVVPFKPQNMALNSAVTADGGEIGRAQAVQACAAGLPPHVDMNPILLKPTSDTGCQVIVHGRSIGDMEALPYHAFKPMALAKVLESHARLAAQYEVIVVEGAGSPAEINLRERDIANMGFAEAVDCPVLLVGDIDRGGLFAQFVGTLALLSASEQERVKGFIVNRFRGDQRLLDPGLRWLEEYTTKPVWGVVPYLRGLFLEAEDSFFNHHLEQPDTPAGVRIVVPVLPRISNQTDFDPLRLHPDVALFWVAEDAPIPPADLIILPGSKNVRADLAWLRAQGWEEVIQRHLRYGGKVIGLCGGFQMLGQWLHDPDGVEGEAGSVKGLELLAMETTFHPSKALQQNHGVLVMGGVPVAGYEIHQGQSSGPALDRPAMLLTTGPHGALSADGRILGTYLHGLFDSPEACTILLAWAGLANAEAIDFAARREEGIERLADAFERTMHMELLEQILGLNLT